MADNVTLNAGSGGSVLAADDIASVFHQRVKIEYGADGSATDVSDANPLPIDDAGGSLTVDNGGTFATQVDGAALTALQLLDDVVATDGSAALTKGNQVCGTDGTNAQIIAVQTDGAVNIHDGGNSITVDGTVTATPAATGPGTEAAAQRVTIATDSTGVLSVDDNGSTLSIDDGGGSITIDGTVTATPAATGAGTEAAAQRVTIATDSTGVLSVDDNGGSLTVDGTVSVTHPALGGGVEAGAQRVTIANDSTGVLSIDDAGGSLTVDGTVTVTHPQLGGGTESGAQRVTIANDSTGVVSVDDGGSALTVDNDGTFATQATLTPSAAAGGHSFFKSIDLDESEEEVKGSGGRMYSIFATNNNAAVRFLKVYNATAASITVGSTVPDQTFPIPPDNGGLFLQWPNGLGFGTAITVAATTGVADDDSGAPGANEVVCNVAYT